MQDINKKVHLVEIESVPTEIKEGKRDINIFFPDSDPIEYRVLVRREFELYRR